MTERCSTAQPHHLRRWDDVSSSTVEPGHPVTSQQGRSNDFQAAGNEHVKKTLRREVVHLGRHNNTETPNNFGFTF